MPSTGEGANELAGMVQCASHDIILLSAGGSSSQKIVAMTKGRNPASVSPISSKDCFFNCRQGKMKVKGWQKVNKQDSAHTGVNGFVNK